MTGILQNISNTYQITFQPNYSKSFVENSSVGWWALVGCWSSELMSKSFIVLCSLTPAHWSHRATDECEQMFELKMLTRSMKKSVCEQWSGSRCKNQLVPQVKVPLINKSPMTTSPQSLEVKSWSSQSSDPWWLLVASQYIRTTITLQWSTWANVWAQNVDLEQGERLRAMSRKQKPRPHYEQGPPLSPPPLWRPLGVPQCTFLYPGVYPSVYPGKPWYTGLPAPIMKISQRISSRPRSASADGALVKIIFGRISKVGAIQPQTLCRKYL